MYCFAHLFLDMWVLIFSQILFFCTYIVGCQGVVQLGGLVPCYPYPFKVPLRLRLIGLFYSLKVPLKLKIKQAHIHCIYKQKFKFKCSFFSLTQTKICFIFCHPFLFYFIFKVINTSEDIFKIQLSLFYFSLKMFSRAILMFL